MKIKTQVFRVRSDEKKFARELEKIYNKAVAENVSEKPPEIQYSFAKHGDISWHAALVIWFVK